MLAGAPAYAAAIAIDRATLHQFEDGPVLPASHIFLPGETVFFSCRLAGYQPTAPDPKTEARAVNLTWRVDMTDPQGIAIVPAATGRIAEPFTSKDKDWMPKFLHSFVVPAFAPTGAYRIRIQVSDLVSKTEVSNDVTFQVRGHAIEPSQELVARGLHFLKSEREGPGLNPALYHPGETLWARFDIIGFSYGEKNRFQVEYGLAVLTEAGRQVFAQPAAASDSNESFYRQNYVVGALSLNLNPQVPPGNYILVITMEDKMNGKTGEARAPFEIAP